MVQGWIYEWKVDGRIDINPGQEADLNLDIWSKDGYMNGRWMGGQILIQEGGWKYRYGYKL